MSRLFVHVEGQTEETFVNEILRPHLVTNHGFHDVNAKLMGNARARSRRGGIRSWPEVRKEILTHLRSDTGKYLTTMVDYYGLPTQKPGAPPNPKAWPGRDVARTLAFPQRAPHVEASLLHDISLDLDDARRRFIPFVLMHEFEALLFADTSLFASVIGRPEIGTDLAQVLSTFNSPEEINDHPLTAPSKRIQEIFIRRGIGSYEKPMTGVLAAIEIGLVRMRATCPHFAAWLARLEGLTRV
jgi:hypothetical protein